MLDGIALTTEAVLESVAMVTWEGMSSTTKSELESVAMGMERSVAMTTVSGCYVLQFVCQTPSFPSPSLKRPSHVTQK